MTRCLYILVLVSLSACLQAQSVFSITSGRWVDITTWSGIVPDSTSNVSIGFVHSDTIDSATFCNDLTIYGELVIDDGGSLYIGGDLFIYGGTLNIDSGKAAVIGETQIGGNLDIVDGPNAYIQFSGSVGNDFNTNMVIHEGGVIVYSGSMSFAPAEEEEEEIIPVE